MYFIFLLSYSFLCFVSDYFHHDDDDDDNSNNNNNKNKNNNNNNNNNNMTIHVEYLILQRFLSLQ